jgi:hypothetical protein
MWNKGALLPLVLLTAACDAQSAGQASPFPNPQRPVAPIVSSRYSDEDARDSIGEFETVVKLAGVQPGMSVADIGAGEGYYTIRLSPLVGPKGRVLAQDIVPATRDTLADRVFLIHMYHEIERPSEFLWHVRSSLKREGRVIVVDADRSTDRHGTPPKLLVCEFSAVGYELTKFERLSDSESYFAQFEARGARPTPDKIPTCPA